MFIICSFIFLAGAGLDGFSRCVNYQCQRNFWNCWPHLVIGVGLLPCKVEMLFYTCIILIFLLCFSFWYWVKKAWSVAFEYLKSMFINLVFVKVWWYVLCDFGPVVFFRYLNFYHNDQNQNWRYLVILENLLVAIFRNMLGWHSVWNFTFHLENRRFCNWWLLTCNLLSLSFIDKLEIHCLWMVFHGSEESLMSASYT